MSDRDVRRALVGCVRSVLADQPVAPAVPPGRGLDALVAAARRHGVSGFVRAAGVASAELRDDAAVAAGRHLRALAEIDRLTRVLAGVDWLVLKGPALAELHGSPTLRSPVDLDVLVARASFADAVARLEAAGCAVYERNWDLVRRARLGSLRLHTPAGTLLDVHWDLLNTADDRAAFAVSSTAALARRVPLGTGGAATLDAVDTAVHLALHAALAGAHRLVWLADVARALRAAPWDDVVARAERWGVTPALGVVARRARLLAGSGPALPARGAWAGVCAAADAVAPPGSWRGGPSVAAAVARSCRSTAARSLRELRRKTGVAARHGGAPTDVGALFDAVDPASVAYPSGGAAARAAYLADVTEA